MDTRLILFSIIIVLIVGVIGFGVRALKLKKQGVKVEPQDFLKDFTSLVISLAGTSLKLLSEDSNKYPTKDAFETALATTVAKELKKELLKSDMATIASFIPDEEYTIFVKNVFKLYTKEINISEIFTGKKEEPKIEAPTEPVVTDSKETSKELVPVTTNIVKDLTEIVTGNEK